MGATTALTRPVGPVAVPSGLNVRLVTVTATTVTIAWDLPSWQEGFVPTIDGSEILTDGKRHPNTSKTQANVKIGRLRDGKRHLYGVNVLGIRDSGAVGA